MRTRVDALRFRWRLGALAAVLLLCGCGTSVIVDPPPPPPRTQTLSSVHIVCPNGSFAWWQLLWPHVEVAEADMPAPMGFAYHEAAAAGTLVPEDPMTGDRAWFASSQAPWRDAVGDPYPRMEPTMFMAGRDETHTPFPKSAASISPNADLLAGIAALQTLDAQVALPVVGVEPFFYGTAPGAPPVSAAADADGLGDLFNTAAGATVISIEPADLQQFGIADIDMVPDSELSPDQRAGLRAWGRMMIVTAKALGLGQTRCVILGMTDQSTMDTSFTNPHTAFDDAAALMRTANVVARIGRILEGFYQYLGAVDDPLNPGQKVIENVLLTVYGDTPHTPLRAGGWPDATPDASNWIYCVGKGHLRHGWFGRVHAMPVGGMSVSGFDPATGMDVLGQPSSASTNGAGAAIAYAVAKGDANKVQDVLGVQAASYAGVVRDR